MEAELKVLVFGSQAQALGRDHLSLSIELPTTVEALSGAIARAYPSLADAMATTRVAVNQTYAQDSTMIQDGDEVALIGPVSGG